MSSAAAIVAVGISTKNSQVEDSRDREMSTTQTVTNAATLAAAAGVASVATVSSTGDLSSASMSLPSSSSSASISHHTLEQHCRLLEEENQQLKESESRLQEQYGDSKRRERVLTRKLANKEQELQDYVAQIAEYKNAQAPGQVALRSAVLDPAVNILFEKLKNELQSTRAKLEETQNELSAWKFTPDSNTGKRLMAKCRLLYQENEELGKMTSNGRLAKLEGELAMQKSFSEEVKKSQSELDDFIQELDEDVEGMQSTILFLQQELKAAKDRIQQLEKENCQMKKLDGDDDEEIENNRHLVNGTNTTLQTIPGRDISDCYVSEERTPKYNNSTMYHIVHNSNNSIILRTSNLISDESSRKSSIYNGNHNELTTTNLNGGGSDMEKAQNELMTTTPSSGNNSYLESSSCSNNSSKANKIASSQRKRNYDSDSSENSSTNGCTLRSNKKLKKKARRSSVLSIDLNEEDTQIADESDDDDNSTSSPHTAIVSVTPVASNQRIMTRRKSARNHQNGGDH